MASVNKDSRYVNEKVARYDYRDGSRPLVTFRVIDREIPAGAHLHTLIATDTLDGLAMNYLGSGEFWWMIADLNPGVYLWNTEDYIGQQIWVPPKRSAIANVRIIDRRVIDLGTVRPSLYVGGHD